MSGYEEFIRRNPALKDADRQEIADYVFETKIKPNDETADRSEFDEYFLGTKPSLLSRMTPDIIEKPVRAIGEAMKGDASLDLPSATDAGLNRSVSGIGAAMFGNDEDYTKKLLENNPKLSEGRDENGNVVLLDESGTPIAYPNQPGLDVQDVSRAGAKIAAFFPAARLASAAGGTAARIGVGGAASAATDAAMQKGAGREEIDKGQTALAGVLGGGGEAAGPLVGKALGAISRRVGMDRWSRMPDTQKSKLLGRQLRDDGISADDVAGMNIDELREFAEARMKQGAMATPDSTMGRGEFGYKITRGQSLPDGTDAEELAKFNQLSREEMLASSDGPAGTTFRKAKAFNEEQTGRNIEKIQGGLSGGYAQADDAMEAAQIVKDGLQGAERTLKQKVDDAYATARDRKANLYAEFVEEMPSRMSRALDEQDVVVDDLTPAAANAMREMERFATRWSRPAKGPSESAALAKPGEAAADAVEVVKDVPIAAIERQRRRLGRFYDKADNAEDRRAVRALKGQFDDMLDEAIDAKLFVGDDDALDALKEARSLHADYSRKFRSDDEAGKAVQKMLDIEATPEQVANYMIGVNGLSKAGAARVVSKYRGIVGEGSDEWNALREMTFLTIARRPNGDSKGAQALVSTLEKATRGQGKTLMGELYSRAELAKMKRFARGLAQTVPSGDFARSSGTAERMLRFYNAGGFESIPGAGLLMSEVRRRGAKGAFELPRVPDDRVSALPVAAASAGAF